MTLDLVTWKSTLMSAVAEMEVETFMTLSYQTLSLIGDTFCLFNSPRFIFHLLLKYLLLIFFCRILHHFLLQRVYSKEFCLSSLLFYETSPGFHLILSLKLSSISWWPPSSTSFSFLLLFSHSWPFSDLIISLCLIHTSDRLVHLEFDDHWMTTQKPCWDYFRFNISHKKLWKKIKTFRLVFQGWLLARFRICNKSKIYLIARPVLFPLIRARKKVRCCIPALQGNGLRRQANQRISFLKD